MNKSKALFPVLVCFSFLLLYHTSASQTPAFPGAEGFGATTPGGRGGKVIKVVNLNDHGPGSFREAVEAEGPRIIIFATGGLINLETKLIISNPWVTIAGQTAPGDGICIRGEGIHIRTHDVIIRYLRVRPGDIDFGPENPWEEVDAISIYGDRSTNNIIIDHCSLSWSVDEGVGIWGQAHDITIQHCIISEGLLLSKHPGGGHSMGMLIGKKSTNISVHHNLFAHNNDRNPHINGASKVDFRNNIIYNPGGVAIDLSGGKGQMINLVGNYIIRGPVTKIRSNILLRDTTLKTPKLFVAENIGIYNNRPDQNNWLLVRDIQNHVPNQDMRLDAPFPHPSVVTHDAHTAYDLALEQAGATLPTRDAVDKKVVRDISDYKGSILSRKRHILEWPPLVYGLPFIDSDDDGMPNHWEEAHGLETGRPDDYLDRDGDGYTNIEEYLNNTNPNGNTDFTEYGFSPQSSPASDIALYPQLELAIAPNAPNPFDKSTKVQFSVDQPARLSIRVFDIEGREVASLVDGLLYEGKYEFIWDASNIDPGVYTISLQTREHTKSIKAVISR